MLQSLFKKLTVKLFVSFLLLFLVVVGFYVTTQQSKRNNRIPTSTTPQQNTLTKKESFTIIAFGDSLTAGYGGALDESYPALLEKYLQGQNKNIKVINMGVSGETTTGSLDRVAFVLSQKPSLVLLETGANDMLRTSSPTIAKENIRKIIERFKQERVDVILLGMKSTSSNGKEYRDEFDTIYTSLAQKYSIPLVPFFLEGVALDPSLNTGDGIHPNKAGYEKIINENILPILLPVLKSKGL